MTSLEATVEAQASTIIKQAVAIKELKESRERFETMLQSQVGRLFVSLRAARSPRDGRPVWA